MTYSMIVGGADSKARDDGEATGNPDELQEEEHHGHQGIHGPRDGQTSKPGE